MLLSSETMQLYDRARVFLDEDFTAVEKFTVSRLLFQYLALWRTWLNKANDNLVVVRKVFF